MLRHSRFYISIDSDRSVSTGRERLLRTSYTPSPSIEKKTIQCDSQAKTLSTTPKATISMISVYRI